MRPSSKNVRASVWRRPTRSAVNTSTTQCARALSLSMTIFVGTRGSGFSGSEEARSRRAMQRVERLRAREHAREIGAGRAPARGLDGPSSGPRSSNTSSARPASQPSAGIVRRREDLGVLDVDPVRREDAGDRREQAGPVARGERHLGVAERRVVAESPSATGGSPPEAQEPQVPRGERGATVRK